MADGPDTVAIRRALDAPTGTARLYRRGALAALDRLAARLAEAEKWAKTMEHERDWERDVVHSELLERATAAEARLSEYEQALRELHDAARNFALSFVEGNQKAAGLRMDAALMAARAALSGSAGGDTIPGGGRV